jgi:hypothetical protein
VPATHSPSLPQASYSEKASNFFRKTAASSYQREEQILKKVPKQISCSILKKLQQVFAASLDKKTCLLVNKGRTLIHVKSNYYILSRPSDLKRKNTKKSSKLWSYYSH